MLKKHKSASGITLIALVITIIILLILAGISISQLTGSGLFERAREAEQKSKNAQAEENEILSEYSSIINEYTSGNGESGGNKPTEITWTMNETTGEITGGGKTLHVGDYVNYQAKVTNATSSELTALNTELNTYSGETDNALQNEALEWRILDVKDGQLRLISATPTTKTVSKNKINLSGYNGYNNAVYLIDNACNTLYNSNYASKVQNLKIEDIESRLTYDYTQYANSNVDTGKYGGTKEYTENRYYPNIFAKETTGWVDENKGTELGLSEQKELITGKTKASSKIKVTQTYWQKEMASSDFKNSIYYTLFINNGSNYSDYWMSSRCVYADSSRANFYVRRVCSGGVGAIYLYYSYDDARSDSYAFRPVITLKSNVLIGEGNGSSTPYEINM